MIEYRLIASLVVASFIGLLGAYVYHLGYEKRDIQAKLEIAHIKAEAAEKLKTETDKVTAIEANLRDFKDIQEFTDATNEKAVSILADKLHASRLRDPNAVGCRSAEAKDSTPADNRPTDGAEAGRVLSAQLTGLLAKLTREADEVNLAYISCRADSADIRAILKN